MTGYNGLNSVKTNLAKAGICKHDGLRFTDPKCTHATADQIAYTKKLDADYDFMQEHKDQARLCNNIVQDVQPRLNFFLNMCSDIDAQNGEIGADELDINRWMDELTQPIDPLSRARAIALPNGQLRSMTSYDTVGSGQCLSAEDVDGERLGE